MADVHFTSAYELATQIRAREISPLEVMMGVRVMLEDRR